MVFVYTVIDMMSAAAPPLSLRIPFRGEYAAEYKRFGGWYTQGGLVLAQSKMPTLDNPKTHGKNKAEIARIAMGDPGLSKEEKELTDVKKDYCG